MSSELDRGRDLQTERGRLLQLTSQVTVESVEAVKDDHVQGVGSEYGRGRLLHMSRMRQGGTGPALRPGQSGQPKGILVIR